LLSRLASAEGETRTWLPGLCLLHCELGQKFEAIEALDELGDIRELIPDDLYETTLVYLTDACVWLGDRTRCRQLYDLLRPYRGYNLTMLGAIAHGAASGYLGKLAHVLRREASARELFEEALEFNSSMNAPPILAHTRADCAEFLLNSELENDRARARKLLSQARNTADGLGMRSLIRRIDELMRDGAMHELLSNRELDVLRLVAAGASNKQIADRLHIGVPTVATHVRNILRKTSTRNRTEAASYARSCGLLQTD
jgi:DNA-binding CsgD family transcriptional regulator